jgi:hypothetical protein
MITETKWLDRREIQREVTEEELMVITPYKNSIMIMLRHGIWLMQARHDGTDEGGDIEALKTLCLFRFNQGEQS